MTFEHFLGNVRPFFYRFEPFLPYLGRSPTLDPHQAAGHEATRPPSPPHPQPMPPLSTILFI